MPDPFVTTLDPDTKSGLTARVVLTFLYILLTLSYVVLGALYWRARSHPLIGTREPTTVVVMGMALAIAVYPGFVSNVWFPSSDPDRIVSILQNFGTRPPRSFLSLLYLLAEAAWIELGRYNAGVEHGRVPSTSAHRPLRGAAHAYRRATHRSRIC